MDMSGQFQPPAILLTVKEPPSYPVGYHSGWAQMLVWKVRSTEISLNLKSIPGLPFRILVSILTALT
jgi:hypothetical protein